VAAAAAIATSDDDDDSGRGISSLFRFRENEGPLRFGCSEGMPLKQTL